MSEAIPSLVITPGFPVDCITELVLFGSNDDVEYGNAVKLDEGDWQCSYDDPMSVKTFPANSYAEALQYLKAKLRENLKGHGYIMASAEFRLDLEELKT